jgi:Kef-type K+ transport system membrane component KefB
VSAIHLLIGLLVLAYMGSILVGGRAIRGYGLPSGSEYVLLGVVLGPHVLAVLDASTVRSFEPVVQVGLCWIALVVGADYGFNGERRVSGQRVLAGFGITLLSALFIGRAVLVVSLACFGFAWQDGLLLAFALGAVSCETTRHAVRWVAIRHRARPVSDLVADIADADDAVPLVVIAALFAIAPLRVERSRFRPGRVSAAASAWGWRSAR